jgi:hypothetical protein
MIRCDEDLQNPLSGLLSGHVICAVHESARGTKLPIRNVRYMAAFGGEPDIEPTAPQGRV